MTDLLKRLRGRGVDVQYQPTSLGQLSDTIFDEAADEIERLRAASKWQPIETLPPIDLHVLLWCADDIPQIVVGVLCDDGDGKFWQFVDEALADIQPEGPEPTHWQPLPPLPHRPLNEV